MNSEENGIPIQNDDNQRTYGTVEPLQDSSTAMNIKRNLLVDLFAISFGIGAWIAVNGIWVELPLLVQELPEKWTLPSYLSVIIQIANLGPISYGIARHLYPNLNSVPVIYFILAIGCLSSFLLVFLWDTTSTIASKERSTALLTLVFFMAFVDCTSSVLYIPYMAVWKEIYFTSYLIGEGLSGLLPGFVSLLQGVGGEVVCVNTTIVDGSVMVHPAPLQPNFSITVFFIMILAMGIVSALSFMALQLLPSLRSEKAPVKLKVHPQIDTSNHSATLVTQRGGLTKLTKTVYLFLLVLQAWACFLANGFMVSFQSYSCGPYGNVSYHLAVTLSALASPVVAFATMFLERGKASVIGGMTGVSTVLALLLLYSAFLSPTPPLVGTTIGSVIIVIGWILWSSVTSYVRIEINNVLREEGSNPLFWSGVTTQAGSAVGALTAFGLINWTTLFKSYNPCS